LASYLETAIEIAREASALLRDFAQRNVGFELKGEHDLVTAADRASEKLVVERLRASFPSHSVVAEEGGGHAGSSEFRWYVDPLDGTTNFAHGFPVYNVTLALEQAGELIAGVIADPVRDEIFTAERGAGAFLNGRRIHVSQVKRVEDALVSTGFPSRRRHLNVNVHFFYQLSMLSHGVRRPGAASLKRNPRAAEDEYKLLQLTQSLGLATQRPYYLDQAGAVFSTPCLVIEYIEGQPEFAVEISRDRECDEGLPARGALEQRRECRPVGMEISRE